VATQPGCQYMIRIRGRLGATALSAFPTMASEVRGGETVLTGSLEDRSAMYGVLAQLEALDLEVLELRQVGPTTTDHELQPSKERAVPEATDRNTKTINEFRANEGRVGGPFEGAPMVLVTHRGRKSGHQHVTPMMYLPDETDDSVIYVFATKGGAPSNPDWYYNLTTVGEGSIERGTDSYPVTIREVTGDERERVYAEQARRYPGFADYAKQTEGIRTIPVLALTRT
jgi:deazaflavin-dependent oxidoreductase (nitroreductase family)